VRAVGGAEGVVHVCVDHRRQRVGEPVVVRLLPRVEPQVLEQDDVAVAEPVDTFAGIGPDHVAGDGDLTAQQLAEPPPHGRHRVRRVDLAVGAAEVGGQYHAGAAVEQQAQGRQRGLQPQVVGHGAAVQRGVQVGA
jgi:hypothetical protein